MLYLGIDQHKRQLTVNVRGEDGSVILKRQVSTQGEKVRAFFADLAEKARPDGLVTGLVAGQLWPDGTPQYIGNGAGYIKNFADWYHNVGGVNIPLDYSMTLARIDEGIYRFSEMAFFPIDGQGWGNDDNGGTGYPHNNHFTMHLENTTDFVYQDGAINYIEVTSDDDMWVFINGHLAIDLGGPHGAMTARVDLAQNATQFELADGEAYVFDVFFAERQRTGSAAANKVVNAAPKMHLFSGRTGAMIPDAAKLNPGGVVLVADDVPPTVANSRGCNLQIALRCAV